MTSIPIIDIEASGLHADSYPIEIAVMVDGQVHAWLIRPEPVWQYWSERAEEMHGISREQLVAEGQSAATVARYLDELAEGGKGVLYSDAAFWDGDWLKILFCAAGLPLRWKVRSIFELLTEDEAQIFLEVQNELEGSGRFQVHRAGEDVRMLQLAYGIAKR